MSAATRPRVRAGFPIGPWVPGGAVPVAVGVVGAVATVLALQDLLVVAGLVLALWAALRVRSAAPWLLIALLVVGQLQREQDALGAELPALVLAVHLLIVLTSLARVLPVRARVQLAALGPAAVRLGLVQVPTQVLAAVLLLSAGRLQVVPEASTIAGALLVLVTGLLVVPRRAERED